MNYDCRDKGPRSYIVLWVLFEDEQTAIRSSQLKSHK